MAMYRAYFDESTGNDSPILVVAGFLADDRLWGRFEPEWKAVLNEWGLTAFHASHFATRKKEFRGMSESDRQGLIGRLLDVIRRQVQFGFATVVHIKDYNSVFQGMERVEAGSAYALCCLSCAFQVGEWAKLNDQAEPVGFFFDDGNPRAGEALTALLAQKKDPTLSEYKIGGIAFDDDERLVPLQAADLAAYEIWKWLDEHFAEKKRHGRFPLQQLVRVPWTIREFDREVLLELRNVQRGGTGNPRTIRHVIQALLPGITD